ncbi:hypothetical protein FA13DRAFT_1290958 [Coprinellus micaceus]|uniref:Uncharacterized protein n=1 Tax=Coprinellus micaceus TaxID=71717 RepID=A0A4Y7R680_COPMI|nr:hypothetical protein FA13DRAFT_1290958 [Coprinellus micaceus]
MNLDPHRAVAVLLLGPITSTRVLGLRLGQSGYPHHHAKLSTSTHRRPPPPPV